MKDQGLGTLIAEVEYYEGFGSFISSSAGFLHC